jgi:hypothetical protein
MKSNQGKHRKFARALLYKSMSELIYTKEALEEAAAESNCFREMFRKLGATVGGATYQRIKFLIAKHQINIDHFLGRKAGIINSGLFKNKKHFSEILTDKQPQRIRSKAIRRALLESGVPHFCSKCGIGPKWNGEKLTLQVDHINGDWSDCRQENLRFLCPNCHSQEPTFCNQGKGKKCVGCGKKITSKAKMCGRCSANTNHYVKVKNKPTKEELQQLVWSKPTTEIAKQYGVTDKAIEKWCKKCGVEKPPRGYWQKQKFGVLV